MAARSAARAANVYLIVGEDSYLAESALADLLQTAVGGDSSAIQVMRGDETTWVRWEMYVDTDRKWLDAWKNGAYHLGSWSGAGGTIGFRPAADWRFRSPALEGYEFDGESVATRTGWPRP